METFTEPKALVDNPHYHDQRRKSLARLSDDMIDAPIVGLINPLNRLPHCFTLQCCFGHFVYPGQTDRHNLERLPVAGAIASVEYRLAYVCLVVENSAPGRDLLALLSEVTALDPSNIQFCCAEWFWERQVNSYALQVIPDRFKHQDTAVLSYAEALHVQNTRDAFFVRLQKLPRGQTA